MAGQIAETIRETNRVLRAVSEEAMRTVASQLEWMRQLTPAVVARMHSRMAAGDPRGVDELLVALAIKPSPAARLALHKIITRSSQWRRVDGFALLRYLRVAVRRESKAIQRQWLWDGILRGKARAREARAACEFVLSQARTIEPDQALMRQERIAAEIGLLSEVRDSGSDRDRAILDLLEQGLSPAATIETLGLKWSAWQAFQRRAQRLRDRKSA